MSRVDGRQNDEHRQVTIQTDFLANPLGSVLISFGNTKVICSVTFQDRVPRWLVGSRQGWLTAEYSMLPGSTHERTRRESRGHVRGRTKEIQRLIGRAIRSIIDLEKLGEYTLWVDCDVIQADGGTRTASITGAYVALELAIEKLIEQERLLESPLLDSIAATSVGIVDDEILLDLCYKEDSSAEVDLNLVMTGSGKLVEVQATAEGVPFSTEQLSQMVKLGKKGIDDLLRIQKECKK